MVPSPEWKQENIGDYWATGDAINIASNVSERHGEALSYRFTGTLAGGSLSGDLDMGEYLKAKWTARRRAGNARG